MAEKTLDKPLSGDEIIEAIIHDIRSTMQRDCRIAKHMAYGYFSAKAHIEITLNDHGSGETHSKHDVEVSDGKPAPDETDPITDEVNIEIEPAPPNEVRQRTKQGVPVLSQEDGRLVERRVKYREPRTAKAK